ncbi:unnamed protein product [Brassica oleracea var. botrytis]
MDEPAEGGAIAATAIQQTPRRNVRRKLVQSTLLLPRKPDDAIESDGDRTRDAANNEDGEEGGDVDFGSSQGKKTRKQRTPKNNGAPKKMAKGKSPRKPTPKKNATKNGVVAGGDDDQQTYVSPPVPNLRLEAKLRAEEDSRMSAGKQLHPFFSSRKGGKKNQEAAKENGSFQEQGKDQIGPIHVFERFQDGYLTIDWKNWTFVEHVSTAWSSHQQIKFESLKLGLKEFDLIELPTLSHPDVCVIDDEKPEKCATQSQVVAEASPLGSLDGAQVVGCEAVNLSNYGEATADVSHELQSGQSRSSLWVDKYQPRNASEVCGNTEAVKLMNEWLCQWRERGFQASQDFLRSDAENSQDADYNCSESDSDSENTDCLKNVLLIIGPVGSGKSAAVYACTKEQGFKIIESNASECRSGTVVKQKFGEALESNSLSRSLEPLFNSCTDGNGVEDVIEVTPVANLKPLILFEDVDISFAEDRGLVSAIQEIAKKAKGPVVLTANDKNHGLPDNLERIEICFSFPSTEELFSHLSSVCAAEEVKANPDSLQRLTISSGGDIRKAIMQLQFWIQSKSKRVRKAKNTGEPDRFDHEAGHVLLPKIIAQEFPSQLSQFVESEIAKSLSMAEESYDTVEVFVEEVENEKMLDRLWRRGIEKNTIEAKKAAMLRLNTCFEDCDELEDVPSELTDTSYQTLSLSRPNRRRKLNVVMSSDSEDEPLSDINEVSHSVDVSCVPESSYVPETIMDGEAELSPRAVSCGHFDGRVEASMSEDDDVQNSLSTEIHIDKLQGFDCLMNTCEIIAQSSDGTMMEDYVGSSQKMQQVTDECSRIDFGMAFKAAQKPKLDTVQESWRKLCSRHADLKPYLDSEPVEAPQLLDITHQITNLISEADLTHSRCLNFVAMEPMMNASGDLDTSGLANVLEQMTSTVSQQGFSFFTNQIATTESVPTSSATMQDYTLSSGGCLDMKPEPHINKKSLRISDSDREIKRTQKKINEFREANRRRKALIFCFPIGNIIGSQSFFRQVSHSSDKAGLFYPETEVLCADFVMEKGKSESSERSFCESESVVSSQSDIQPESTMESHEDEIPQPEESPPEAETENEDLKESIRTLTEKLSAALANVSAKDDLVNQHVKVAEEAVAGWEKAENEVVELKEKLDAAEDKNKALDGALKECVRQLRQARDEQEQRIQDAVTEKTQELQASKANLEGELLEAATKSEELALMAESVAKENIMLRHELLARCEELEIRTIERDLSTQAAESASKQQLDVIKKVAKLEAECRKLRMLLSKSSDSHSDASCSESGASTTLIEKRSLQGTSSCAVEIDLMGDFLEMERLVALPETPDGNGKSEPESVHTDNSLAAEIEVLTCRNKELEEKLEKLEAVKNELESKVECSREVESTLRSELEAILCGKMEIESKLKKLKKEKDELESYKEVESTLRSELEAMVCDKVKLESNLEKLEAEREELESKVKSDREVMSTLRLDLEAKVSDKAELEKNLNKLEAEKDELERTLRLDLEAKVSDKAELEKKLNKLEEEKDEVERTLRLDLEAIVSSKVEVENKLEKMEVEKAELQISYDIIKDKYKESQVCLQDIETKLEEIQREMKVANELKTEVETQIESMEAKIECLEEEVRKERLASDELRRKCEELEEEVFTLHQEEPPKIKQEDMATAAGKLASCQKTIASLGKQLQSLATLEDFLVDTASIQAAATNGVSSSNSNKESWRVHKNDTYITSMKQPAKETSSSSDAALMQGSGNRGSSEKNRNGFAKVFTRSKDGIHLVI